MSKYLRLHDRTLYVQNYNNDFLLLRGEVTADIAQIGTAIFQHKFDFIEEVIVTEVEICLKLNAKFHPAKIGLLSTIQITKNKTQNTFKLAVYFNKKEDWKAIESFTGSNRTTIINKLCKTSFSVAMFGFLPGFTYFNGLDKSLHIPRKSVPAKYVPANSIALGGKYLGLYSIASPGGWHVIGQIPKPVLQLPQLPPVALNLGDSVQLYSIDLDEYENLLQEQNLSNN